MGEFHAYIVDFEYQDHIPKDLNIWTASNPYLSLFSLDKLVEVIYLTKILKENARVTICLEIFRL